MKQTDELKKTIEDLKSKVQNLQAQEQYDDAASVAKELKDAVRDYKTAKAIEDADLKDFQSGGMIPAMKQSASAVDEKKLVNRAFNKLVFGDIVKGGAQLTDDETQALKQHGVFDVVGTPGQVGVTPSKGGYLVPEEQLATLREYRRQYYELKSLCNVQTANSTSGKMPTIGKETGKLVQFDELTEIHQEDLDFGQISYNIADYGDIIPVSNQLLQDADIDLMALIGQRFARKSVNTENEKILDILSKLSATTIKDWKGITKALNVTLDPAISAGAKILTNQDGIEYLDELTDSQGRPLLTQSLADPTKFVFRGREIIVVSNALLTAKSAIPFYVGSFADMLAFFQRKGVEVAVSQEAGFTKYATYVRAVERFGVVKDDADAVVSLSISATA